MKKLSWQMAVKACLVTAATGLFSSQLPRLRAEEGLPAAGQTSECAKVLQAQGFSSASRSTGVVQVSGTDDSAVQRELQRLARKNNRDFPSMTLDEAPHTDGDLPSKQTKQTAGLNDAPAVATATPPTKASKPNWFERTFHVGRGKRKPAPVAEATPPAAQKSPAYRFTKPSLPRSSATANSAAATAAPRTLAPNALSAPQPIAAAQAGRPTAGQPALKEPAPLAPSATNRELHNVVPESVKLTRPQNDAAALLDETADDEDDSLDMDGDETKVAEQTPAAAAETETAEATPTSPYSGRKISPNEEELQSASRPQAKPAADDDDEDEDDDDDDMDDVSRPAAKPAPAKSANGLAPAEDDDDLSTLPSFGAKSKPGSAAAGHATQVKAEAPAKEPAPKAFTALKGACPVVLRDSRKLSDADPKITAVYQGRIFCLSSAEAKKAFEENPSRYVPAACGIDLVKAAAGEKNVEGTIDHAAWYRGRLYLFATAESRAEFADAPRSFAVEE
ncbi:MAG: hypothetical protein JSS02_01620 [Planctomycetes bacterium]|nr:hypothetical protein [Planctomycetota bacterium]